MTPLLLWLLVDMQDGAGAGQKVRPTPINAGQWISADDYPAPAIRAAEEGRVAFELEVDASGVVTSCTIVTSSGSALLDVHTCDLMQLRARFVPARDAQGDAVRGSYGSSVTWRIPDGTPFDISTMQPLDRTTVELRVASDGRIAKCAVIEAVGSGNQPTSISPCAKYPPGSRYSYPTRRNGRPVSGRVRITVSETRTYD